MDKREKADAIVAMLETGSDSAALLACTACERGETRLRAEKRTRRRCNSCSSRVLICTVVVALVHCVAVALLPSMERTMYRYTIVHADRWFRYVSEDSVAPLTDVLSWLLISTGFPYLVHAAPGWHSHSWHEGALPSYLALLATESSLDLMIRMQTKTYWASTFAAHGIPTPRTLAVVEDGVVRSASPHLDKHATTIVKPNQGWMGRGVQRASLARFSALRAPGQWIVQQPVATLTGATETVRVVTMLNGSIAQPLVSLRLTATHAKAVTSNRGVVRCSSS
jgi:hypothetical protein